MSCTHCLADNCFIKQSFNSNEIGTIENVKIKNNYKKDTAVFIEGGFVDGIYFICEGKVKITSKGYNRKDHIVRLASNGHILGHKGIGSETYPISAIVLENSSICFIKNEDLYKMFMMNPVFLYKITVYYAKELRLVESRLKYSSQMVLTEKVVEALLYVINVFGINQKTKEINVYFTREEYSQIVGTNAEQISRALNQLKHEGIISLSGKKIIINQMESLHKVITQYNLQFF